MLYLFWVTHPPFGFDLYPLLACWEHCQMFYQPVYLVKEWEVAEAGECPFCDAILAADKDKEDERQMSLFEADNE